MNIEPCDTKYYGIIPCKKACCVVEEKMAARLQAHADMGLPPGPQPEVNAGDPPYYASKSRTGDMPLPGQQRCTKSCANGEILCALRSGHGGYHCSQTGSEWMDLT